MLPILESMKLRSKWLFVLLGKSAAIIHDYDIRMALFGSYRRILGGKRRPHPGRSTAGMCGNVEPRHQEVGPSALTESKSHGNGVCVTAWKATEQTEMRITGERSRGLQERATSKTRQSNSITRASFLQHLDYHRAAATMERRGHYCVTCKAPLHV